MLAIKLQRIGKKHQPHFRIVVAEKRSRLIAPPVEDVGSYNPFTKAVSAEKERVAYWIKSGAKPTPTVWNLLVKAGAVSGPKIAIKINKPEKVEAPAATAATPETVAPTAEVSGTPTTETAAPTEKPATE
ncbi:MAG: 30S ribosomal protein S16 [Candidatus Liptonbacteria bacterium]|nr:30S ribosomal protein S16 [Candidatus Liptonbacteria bacterium]